MNLNQLYYFRELAEKGQYTKAADALYISQPTLSVSIKSLEKELGCSLFTHDGRFVKLTKYGRQFYNTVITTLNVLDKGVLNLKQTINKDNGTINIACIPTSVGTLLPPLIKKYNQTVERPPHFIYHDNPSLQIAQGISKGWYDIGIMSYVSDFPNLTYIPFYTEEIIAIVSNDSQLAQINEISPEELRGERLLTYTQKIEIGRNVTDALLSSEPDLSITNRMHDELAIAGQVITNNVVGIVANTIYLDGFDVHKIKLDIPENTRKVFIGFDPNNAQSEQIEDFIDFLKSEKDNLKDHI